MTALVSEEETSWEAEVALRLVPNLTKPLYHDNRAVEVSLPEKHLTGSHGSHSGRSRWMVIMVALCFLVPVAFLGIMLLSGLSIPFSDSYLLLAVFLLCPIAHLLFMGKYHSQ
ncbi:MAG: hypothetical protein ACE5OZ_18150 [Candidatus Heimdallarchaeota archaeon]